MPKYRSHTSTQGRNMAGARSLWRATGMTDEDFNKPIIASYNLQQSPAGLAFPLIYICPTNAFYRYADVALTLNKSWARENAENLLEYAGNRSALHGFLADKLSVGQFQ